LIGLKATRGLISFGPERGENYYGSSGPGIMTRSVRDAAAGLDVMIGTHSPDPAWSPRPSRPFVAQLDEPLPRLRIAVCTSFPYGAIDAEVVDLGVRPVAELLAANGHAVEDAAPDWMTIISAASLPMSMPGPAAAVDPADDDKVEPRNRVMLQRMRHMTVLEHSREVDQARAAAREFVRFWDTYDVLLTPAFGTLPPAATWARWDMSFEEHSALLGGIANFAWPLNIAGQPALSVPLGWTAESLPIGVQLAGKHLDEGLLLRLAAELETSAFWDRRTPPDF
jgi:amidase